MPAADAVLLPLCVGLSLLGLLITVVAWRRSSKGRVLQGLALALAPVALYFSGLLPLLWRGVVAIVAWASRVVLSPPVWLGLSLLALCVVLWVVGGLLARRAPRKARQPSSDQPAVGGRTRSTAKAQVPASTKRQKSAPAKPPVDDDMAEIEALLKSRGID